MSFDRRQGDLYIFTTLDGGEISITLGEPTMDQGFDSAVLLSLAGTESRDWWANEYLEPNQRINSRFARFAQGNVLNSASILTGEDLAQQDLAWMISEGICDEVSVSMTAISRNRVEAQVDIEIDGQRVALSPFQLNWQAQENFPAQERV